jgi:hypothetical protein
VLAHAKVQRQLAAGLATRGDTHQGDVFVSLTGKRQTCWSGVRNFRNVNQIVAGHIAR